MVVTVQYLTAFDEITRKSGEKVELQEKSSVRDLINKLVDLYGTRFREIIFPQAPDKVGALISIMVKGTDVRLLSELNTRLNDGDSVMMAIIVMGG
jgi:molybdopterin converting factor small subunit